MIKPGKVINEGNGAQGATKTKGQASETVKKGQKKEQKQGQ